MSDRDDVNVDYIVRTRSAGERADLMCFNVPERHDVAAPKEPPQLRLSS
jgi:hypothetical protein